MNKIMVLLSGDFVNKYYFPVFVPIGVTGNILSFLVSTFEICEQQINSTIYYHYWHHMNQVIKKNCILAKVSQLKFKCIVLSAKTLRILKNTTCRYNPDS